MKTFASNKPADIKVQLEAHFDKFEPTHPGRHRVQGLRGGKVRWVCTCKPKHHSTAEGGVQISEELGSTHSCGLDLVYHHPGGKDNLVLSHTNTLADVNNLSYVL